MEQPLDLLTNIKMNLSDVPEDLSSKDFYGKVIETAGEARNQYRIRFTSASPEIAAYFQALRQYGTRTEMRAVSHRPASQRDRETTS